MKGLGISCEKILVPYDTGQIFLGYNQGVNYDFWASQKQIYFPI